MNPNNTKHKLEFLNKYASKRLKSWRNKYSTNIVGVHIGHKEKGDTEKRYYSIVFHVKQKEKSPKKPIPKKIEVIFPDKSVRQIPTDVIEVKDFELRFINLGDRIERINSNSFGSIGVFLKKNNRVYACSNMHVLAPNILNKGQNYFYKPINKQLVADIALSNDNSIGVAFLEKSIFDGIDAGIARIEVVDTVRSRLGAYNANVAGYKVINWANYRNLKVFMSGNMSGRQEGIVKNIGLNIFDDSISITLRNLIKVEMFSQRGDSGAPVFDENYRIIGILLGGTATHSYVIPIVDILNFFKMDLLI